MESSNLLISEIMKDTSRFNAYLRLFQQCFPGASKYTYKYLKWLYLDNPYGTAIGFDAIADNHVVAHYAVIPFPAIINGKECLACWSLNTATHPNYQGRGLFVRLADLTYDLAKKLGCVAVIGIANKNSTPGFVNKLNFKLLGQLKTRFGYFKKISLTQQVCSYRKWPEDLLKWRLSNPSKSYYYRLLDGHKRIYTHTPPFKTPVVLGCCDKDVSLPESVARLSYSSYFQPSFFVSYNYNASGVCFELSQRLLPSPWNVIYRDLNSASVISSLDIGICGLDSDTF